MTELLFALPVEVLLRTSSATLRDQDVAERFALAMNAWTGAEARRLAPGRYGLSQLLDESAP